jgi:hypothetical protein
MLSLLETLHWSLPAAGEVSSPDFFEREVDNFRLFQSSFLLSGDSIVRLASELAEREQLGPGGGAIRRWDELDGPKWRENQWLEIASSEGLDRISPTTDPTAQRPAVLPVTVRAFSFSFLLTRKKISIAQDDDRGPVEMTRAQTKTRQLLLASLSS